jgi:Arc/MetJ-type ribon-helix-helix transcriptional regulator
MAAMTLTLTPETEQLINDELKSGHYKDAEDVIQRALRALKQQAAVKRPPVCRTPQEAAAHIRELRQGNTLGGLTIKALINEGRP